MKQGTLFLALAIALLGQFKPGQAVALNKVVTCYFEEWAAYRWSYGFFDVEDIVPTHCTHLVFCFAGIDQDTYELISLDEYNDYYDNFGKGAYDRFTDLKIDNPDLKTYLAVGGWNEGFTKFSEMVGNATHRTTFINSAVALLTAHNFDGLDLDWEYPGGRPGEPGNPDDKANFVTFLQEIRAAFDQHNLDVTAAVAANEVIIDQAYDVPALNEYLTYIHLMSYDYHLWAPPNDTYIGHNTPLHPRPEEEVPTSQDYHKNVEFSVNYLLDNGASPEKLVMGVAAYGRGYYMTNPSCHDLDCPASAPCDPGIYTGTYGFWGYMELCEEMFINNESSLWTYYMDPYAQAPNIYSDTEWIGFDDPASIFRKAQFAKEKDLAGAMIWSINMDDFHNLCGDGQFPLIAELQWVLNEFNISDINSTPKPETTTLEPPDVVCEGTAGNHPDPEDCASYYICNENENGGFDVVHEQCPEGLLFDPELLACNWPSEVDC